MKLKKRQFARLKDIAEEVNTSGMFGLGGIKLNKLIADIESVQKVKEVGVETILENPVSSSSIYSFAAGNIFDDQKKAVDDYIRRQGESMVAASTDETTIFKGGLRDAVKMEVTSEQTPIVVEIKKGLLVELYNFAYEQAKITGMVDVLHEIDRLVYSPSKTKATSTTEPKIGDVGYFFGSGAANLPVLYGILGEIGISNQFPYITTTGQYRYHFSKTPPELK